MDRKVSTEALAILIQSSRQNRSSALGIFAAIVFFYAVFISFIIFAASKILH